ncbi:hypothetical protein BCR35DRAFT_194741 [Leucosporidium creatinivorum]|uniref:GmrSD restriction endonucleases N-terminal domain-containing protein n=1 Tax=Leucosporidium creatinivorum TaxID=106004 RepID=A0A1Y2DTW7_9BASI|nr:hypothetical protein BCR35DRAFT_194741 [Leucosporidium creatinivorum]
MSHWQRATEMIVLSSDDEDDERHQSQSQQTAPLSPSPAAPPDERRAALPPPPVRPGQAVAAARQRGPSVKREEEQMVGVALVGAEEEDQLQEDDGGDYANEEDEEDEVDELKPDDIDSDGGEPLKPYDPQLDPAQVLPVKLRGVKTVKEIFRMVENGTIDLSPDYQRDFVWSKDLQQGLINSLLKNMHVPELLFNIVEDEDVQFDEAEDAEPRKIWTVTDGKQRISSICAFMRGEFFVRDDAKTAFHYRSPPGKPKVALSKAARAEFDALELRYVAYDSLTDDQERELFQRIQLGQRLSSGQKYKAVAGLYADWITSLVGRYLDKSTTVSFKPRIARLPKEVDSEVFTRAVMYLQQGLQDVKFACDSDIRRTLKSNELPSLQRQARISEIFDRLQRLSLVPQLEGNTDTFPPTVAAKIPPGTPYPHEAFRPTVKRVVSPIEMGWLPMIVEHWWDRTDGELLEIIGKFRDFIFAKCEGAIKTNPTGKLGRIEVLGRWS